MTVADKDQPTKITVQIWEPLYKKFHDKIRNACLRRDTYLEKLLATELPYLDSAVCIPNSQASYDHVAKLQTLLPRRGTSLTLRQETADTLDAICATKKIVRDAFFNRIFLLLCADPKYIDKLWFAFVDDENWRSLVWSEFKHEGPFFERGFYPLEPAIDPFWAIRAGLQVFNEDSTRVESYFEPITRRTVNVQRGLLDTVEPLTSVYTVYFHQTTKQGKKGAEASLGAFNCYVPDCLIPGSAAQREHQAALDDILASV